MKIIAVIAALVLAGCAATQPPSAVTPPVVPVAASAIPAEPTPSILVDTPPTGLTLPSLTGDPATDIKNLLGWLVTQNVADLTAARDIAANATPVDLAGQMCHSWAAQTLQSLPVLSAGKPFADVKGPISAFEKARVLLAGSVGGAGTGVNGLLEQFNINCSPYIQSINYRLGKGSLLIAGAATTGGAAGPAFGAVQQLINSAPKLFFP